MKLESNSSVYSHTVRVLLRYHALKGRMRSMNNPQDMFLRLDGARFSTALQYASVTRVQELIIKCKP